MTIQEWLGSTHAQLASAGIATARLDSLVLMSDELAHDKSWVLAHSDHILQRSEIDILNTKVAQRMQHIPLAYIRGKVEFYGRNLSVCKHVLVPRPESESIIELLKALPSPRSQSTIIDIGTGSGALAITVKLEFPAMRVIATDIDKTCLKLAKQNAVDLSAQIEFLQGDLLEPLTSISLETNSQTTLMCNLPYVPIDFPINRAATHEPSTALFSGYDGLDHYLKLCAQLDVLSATPDYILTESLVIQHAELTKLLGHHGYIMHSSDSLAQCFKHTK